MDQAPFTLGPWTVDPASNEIRDASGRAIRIEARAMDVLALLHERSPRPVTHAEILDAVWPGTVVSPHSIAIVISDLRRALGESSREPHYIETIPKRGYRLTSAATPVDDPLPRTAFWHRWLALGATILAAVVLWSVASSRTGSSGSAAAVRPAAMERYSQARQLWSHRSPASAVEAKRLLEGVLGERPDFAPAHAALADIYTHKTGEYLGLPALDAFRAAQRHLDTGLSLDPGLADLYVSRALIEFDRDRQPRKALASVDEALERDPSLARAWQARGMVLSALGDRGESLEAIGKARALDPASPSIAWDEVWFLYVAREYPKAKAALERASQEWPRNYLYDALIEEALGHPRRAVELWVARFEPRGVLLPEAESIRALARKGSIRAAYAEMLRQVALRPEYAEDPSILAIWSVLAGDTDGAIRRLEAPSDRESWIVPWLPQLPILEPLARRPAMAPHVGG